MKPLLHLAVAALLVATAPAHAQQPPDTLPAAAPVMRDSILRSVIGGQWRRAERGFSVASLHAERDAVADAPSLPRALQGRIAGARVTQGEGYAGSDSRVWLRGPASLMHNEPLLIVDGVRAHAGQPLRTQQLPGVLDDIDMESVEHVEVLRGVAATAIYGPGASRGVILVTTRRGAQGRPRWSAFAEAGPMIEATEFPANFGTLGTSTATGEPVANCPLYRQGEGTCTATSRQSWNPLEDASPFRTGWSTAAGLAVAGGSQWVDYRVGGNHERATGVYETDEGRATNAHVNLGLHVIPTLDLRLAGSHRAERFRRPGANVIGLGLGGASVDDPVRRGFAADIDAAERARRRVTTGTHVRGSLEADWRARDWLRARANIGYDVVRMKGDVRERFARSIEPPSDSATGITGSRDKPSARTLGLELEGSFGSVFGGTARSVVGVQEIRENDRGYFFQRFQQDGAEGPYLVTTTSLEFKRKSGGVYALQHLGWSRAFVTGSLRVDSPEGPMDKVISPGVDVSWLAITDANDRSSWLDELRVRGAFARGGGLLIGGELGPSEIARELELGADIAIFDRRAHAVITFYRATTDNGVIEGVPPPAGSGFPTSPPTNKGRFGTTGFEASVGGRLMESARFAWDAEVDYSLHDSDIRGDPYDRPTYGTGPIPEQSIGDYVSRGYTYADLNSDGRISPNEVTLTPDEGSWFPVAGSPFQGHELGVRTTASFGQRIRVTAQVDRRGGQELFNLVGMNRCGIDPNCEAQHDPSTSLADQAAAVAGRSGAAEAGWIEDASYTKLRELSIAIALPQAISGSALSGTLTLTGRNLHTWTSYRGLDPEIVSTNRNTALALGLGYQPPLRTFTARVDLGW